MAKSIDKWVKSFVENEVSTMGLGDPSKSKIKRRLK